MILVPYIQKTIYQTAFLLRYCTEYAQHAAVFKKIKQNKNERFFLFGNSSTKCIPRSSSTTGATRYNNASDYQQRTKCKENSTNVRKRRRKVIILQYLKNKN